MSRIWIIVSALLVPLLSLTAWDAVAKQQWVWALANVGVAALLVILIIYEVCRALEKR